MKSINKIILLTCAFMLAACSSNTTVTSTVEATYESTDIQDTETASPLLNSPTPIDTPNIEETPSVVESTSNDPVTEPETTPESIHDNNPINHDQLLNGDLSSLSGVYVNDIGETITLGDNGLRDHEMVLGSVSYNDVYYANIILDNTDGGYALIIYPVDVSVPNIETDTNTVRIYYGQAEPTSVDQIYSKQ